MSMFFSIIFRETFHSSNSVAILGHNLASKWRQNWQHYYTDQTPLLLKKSSSSYHSIQVNNLEVPQHKHHLGKYILIFNYQNEVKITKVIQFPKTRIKLLIRHQENIELHTQFQRHLKDIITSWATKYWK